MSNEAFHEKADWSQVILSFCWTKFSPLSQRSSPSFHPHSKFCMCTNRLPTAEKNLALGVSLITSCVASSRVMEAILSAMDCCGSNSCSYIGAECVL